MHDDVAAHEIIKTKVIRLQLCSIPITGLLPRTIQSSVSLLILVLKKVLIWADFEILMELPIQEVL